MTARRVEGFYVRFYARSVLLSLDERERFNCSTIGVEYGAWEDLDRPVSLQGTMR